MKNTNPSYTSNIFLAIIIFANVFSCATSEFSDPNFAKNLPKKNPPAYDSPPVAYPPEYYIRTYQQPIPANYYQHPYYGNGGSVLYSNPYIINNHHPDIDKYYVLPINYRNIDYNQKDFQQYDSR